MYRKSLGSWLKHWDFILLDLLCLQAAYIFSVVARNGWHMYHYNMYVEVCLVVALADICTVFFTEEYRGIMRRGKLQEARAVLVQVALVSGIEVLYLFLRQSAGDFSRLSFLVFVLTAFLLIYAERILWKKFLLCRRKNFYRKKGLLIVTTSDRAGEVVRTVLNNSYNELEILGLVLADRDDQVGSEMERIPVVCRMEDIPDYIQTLWLDSILIRLPEEIPFPSDMEETCVGMGITVHRSLAEEGKHSGNQEIDRLGGYVVLSTSIRMASPGQLVLKRALDICGGLVGLAITAVLTVFVAPAIWISSPGPIFFAQIRVGQNGRRFRIYKFRSMYVDAERRKKELMEKNQMQGYMFKMDADPRIIGSGPDGARHGLGWFLRKTSIDEFPQFWNVLKGDMSLVGTRPPTEDEWEQYQHHHRARMAIKPGITGMWQVSGRSDITDFEEVVRLDLEYIRKWNTWLDMKILFMTVFGELQKRGAK